MKTKNFLWGIVGLSALSLTACNADKALDPAKNQKNESAYMTLQLVGPEGRSITRTAAGEDQTEVGTDAQNKISSLKVLLCDPADHKVKASYDVEAGDLLDIQGGVKTKQILTTTGTFDVYVIANLPAAISVADGDVLTDKTIDNVTEALMQSDYAADNKFIMFNECNGTDKIAGSAITITAVNDYDNPATCNPINMDRLAVQIRSTASEVSVADITAKNTFMTAAESKGFKLLNGATKSNLQQKWSNTVADMGATYPWNNVLVTPSLSEGTNAGNDAEYYNHLTDFRTVTITDKVYTTVKDLYESVTAYEPTAKGSIFCMENHPESALMGNTTGLVYQFKATVTGSDNKAGEGCFYGYNDKYFASLADLQAVYPHAFAKATVTETDPALIPAAQLAAAEQELADAYTASDKQTSISDFRVKYNVKVYTEGLMYYTYFIKDKNYQDSSIDKDDKRYYSVMRNTIYDLKVTKLNRIGTDIPGGWTPDTDEPTDPVDPTNVYLVVEATVNNWVLSKEDIELK